MSIKLRPEIQADVDLLLKEDKEWDEELGKQRYKALEVIRGLSHSERGQINDYVIRWLDTTHHNQWQQSWALSTLAQLGCPDGNLRVREHMLSPKEPDLWTRHFALINGANFEPFPEVEIKKAATDREELPRATALRLLIANGFPDYEQDLLNMLQSQQNPNARWAAARALRTRTDPRMKPLSSDSEMLFIPALVAIAAYKYEALDARWECIQALSTFSQKKKVASGLAELLMKETDANMRRYYLEALRELNQAEESRAALLQAVEDPDAQIRVDAANTLKAMIGAEECTKQLVTLALLPNKEADLLLEALRRIDKELAAKQLRDAFGNADIRVSSRANILLTDLGGQTAAQILLGERTKALDRYTRILTDADYEVRQHFAQLMAQAQSAFWISMAMHTVVFLIGVAALTGSLVLALQGGSNEVVTWASGLVGAASLLLTAFYQSPLQNVRGSLNALMQVDVVFLGYVRQINQIDATFKHLFLETHDFGTTHMRETVTEIQSTVNEILEEIQNYILEKKPADSGAGSAAPGNSKPGNAALPS